MIRVAYFPGCSLGATAVEFGESTVGVAPHIGLELVEIEDWNCCGASSGHTSEPDLGVGLPARNLAIAAEMGLDEVVVPCVGCFKMFKQAVHQLSRDGERRKRIEDWIGKPFPVEMKITHILDVLMRPEVLDTIEKNVKRPLTGKRFAPYYGCVGFPPKVMGVPDPENPQTMDRILRLLGAEPLDWPGKVDCCGGNLSLTIADIPLDLVGKLARWARAAGADAFATACPLCQSNIELRQGKSGEDKLPSLFITELIGAALGLEETAKWYKRHLIPVGALMQQP